MKINGLHKCRGEASTLKKCSNPNHIIWQLFINRYNLGPWKSFSMLQCFLIKTRHKSLRKFNHIWFFVRSGLPWIKGMIWLSTTLRGLSRKLTKLFGIYWQIMAELSWTGLSWTYQKLQILSITIFLMIFHSIWCVKVLIVICSNLVVTWKTRPCIGISPSFPPVP